MTGFYNTDGSRPPSKGIVFIKQFNRNPILVRISPSCEGCGQSYSYHIHTKTGSSRYNNYWAVLFTRQVKYYISCPECSFVMELDFAEYKELKKIADENKKDGRY